MTLQDILDEELFWHDLYNNRRAERIAEEQEARRAADARQHSEDMAALQNSVDELKKQLAAERQARRNEEQQRLNAEARFRFEMWSQTDNGRKYLREKTLFLEKAKVVEIMVDAIEQDTKEYVGKWLLHNGYWPNPAYYGITAKGQLLKQPLFGAAKKRDEAVKRFNAAVAKAKKEHMNDAKQYVAGPLIETFSRGFWINEYRQGKKIIQAVEKESQFDQAPNLPAKELIVKAEPGVKIGLFSDKGHIVEALTSLYGGTINDERGAQPQVLSD
ncbi:hypothetical protein [Bifidobacterium callitrichidarum]|uniref:Uncharacterized protein n=1 Tax=Bifidobacterium callitrichidarum TaxID=2052941 RepID=A0A2U2NCJ0_9BIFI|nr:hypothetical protein [Bifidobacterium callitrichidarum]PWG66719.1 hypothetical protein DF196_02110 [Bifidobacterium callitrichidarum]